MAPLTLSSLDEMIDRMLGADTDHSSRCAYLCMGRRARREATDAVHALNSIRVEETFGRQIGAYRGIPITLVEDRGDDYVYLVAIEDI